MSIIITNITSEKTIEAGGPDLYKIRINDKVITTFRHNRPDGLAVCLQRAAHAVAEQDMMELINSSIETFKQLRDGKNK
jgi:hypothetical protein